MTRILPVLGFGQPAEPPLEPAERHDPPPAPPPLGSGSAHELHTQHREQGPEERERRHL